MPEDPIETLREMLRATQMELARLQGRSDADHQDHPRRLELLEEKQFAAALQGLGARVDRLERQLDSLLDMLVRKGLESLLSKEAPDSPRTKDPA